MNQFTIKRSLVAFIAILCFSSIANSGFSTTTITNVSPLLGPVGTLVTITGTGLNSPSSLSIGGVAAISVSNTGTTLVAMVMPGAVTGAVNVGGVSFTTNFTVTGSVPPSVQQGNKLSAGGGIYEGWSVALSADGNTAIVGAYAGVGEAIVYTRSAGIWVSQQTLTANDAVGGSSEQGFSVALSADGNTAIVGGPDDGTAGAAWVYTRSGTTWTQQGSKLPCTGSIGSGGNPEVGFSVSLSADGNTALVGGDRDNGDIGAAWVFTRSSGTWTQLCELIANNYVNEPEQGYSVALSADGKTAIVGGPFDNNQVGAAWVYTLSGGTFVQQSTLMASDNIGNAQQGFSVALSADGNTAMVGGNHDNSLIGAAWVYTRSGSTWTQQSKLLASDESCAANLGNAVSLSADGNTAFVGGDWDCNGTTNSNHYGDAWVYTRSGSVWTQVGTKLKYDQAETSPSFGQLELGYSVALSADGSTAIAGAPENNQTDGLAFVFVPPACNPPSVTVAATGLSGSPITICVAQSVTFTATPTNGGATPTYQWKQSSDGTTFTVISGETNATYTSSTLTNNIYIECILTSDESTTACVLTNANATSNVIQVKFNASTDYTWTGYVNTDWNTADNWCGGSVPSITGGVAVIIPVVTSNNYPLIPDGNVSLAGYTINSGAYMEFGATTSLTLTGPVSGTGVLKGYTNSFYSSLQSLTINGNVSGTLYFDAVYNTLGDLIINSGSATLGSKLNIIGVFLPTAGTINTGGYLTLKSTAINTTAIVGAVGSTAIINGNVTVERCIPKGIEGYRDLSAEVANAGSIFSNWQESGVNTNGYGIQITGATQRGVPTPGNDPSNGLDFSGSGNHSMFYFDNNAIYLLTGTEGVWDSVQNTLSTNLNPYQGYRTMVRGNRTTNLFPPPPQPTGTQFMATPATIRATGQLITGTVTYSSTGVAASNGLGSSSPTLNTGTDVYAALIGNPYVCPIDWNTISPNSTGLQSTYDCLDPTFVNSGGYETYISYNSVTSTSSNPLQSHVNQYIQPGQAFFVFTDGTGTSPKLKIQESDKAAASTKTAIFGIAAPINRIALGLYNKGNNVDGSVVAFSSSFTETIGNEDSYKFSNAVDNIALNNSGKNLSIEGLPMPTTTDTIPIHLYSLYAGITYTLRLDVSQFTGNGVDAYIYDNILNRQTLLVGDSTVVSFAVTSDTSGYANRYSIVFGTSPLPISLIDLRVMATGNAVLVNWSAKGGANVTSYTVERSTNGISFTSIATQKVQGENDLYSFKDDDATVGINYYRIKATALDGSVAYSAVANATLAVKTLITVYPNPATHNGFNLKLSNLPSGSYTIRLINTLGQGLLTKAIMHGGSEETIKINTGNLASDTYNISIISADGTTYRTRLAVQ